MFWNRPQPEELTIPPFEFRYQGTRIIFAPDELKIEHEFNVKIFVNGEPLELDRPAQMRFMREYYNWLDAI